MSCLRTLFLLIFMAVAGNGSCQPQSTLHLSFRLFDKHGVPITNEQFRKKVTFQPVDGGVTSFPWTSKYLKRSEFYDHASRYFHLTIAGPANEFSAFVLIYGRDTMRIKLR